MILGSAFLQRVLPLHDSAEIFAVKLSAWQTEVGAVREWFQRQHINWVPLPGDRSKWWMWNSAKEIARKCVVQIQTYLQRIAEGLHHSSHLFSCKLGL